MLGFEKRVFLQAAPSERVGKLYVKRKNPLNRDTNMNPGQEPFPNDPRTQRPSNG